MQRTKIYQGSSKTLFQTDQEDFTLVMAFNDTAKQVDGSIIEIPGKGVINNNISSFLMQKLDMVGIENHFIEKINMREQLVQFVDVFPIQLSITSLASGRYVTEFGMEEGYVLDGPVIDFRIKNSSLKYPVINEHQIEGFAWLSSWEIKELKLKATRVFDFLSGIFAGIEVRLVEAKLEFGKVYDGDEFVIMLVDEISPDTCMLWDFNTNERLGFELLTIDPQKALTSYKNICDRFGIIS